MVYGADDVTMSALIPAASCHDLSLSNTFVRNYAALDSREIDTIDYEYTTTMQPRLLIAAGCR